MTNPTLERAARALCDATGADWDAITPIRQKYAVTAARAVLMAVLPEMQRYGCDCAGSQVEDDRGEFVLYDDLAKILAEGE